MVRSTSFNLKCLLSCCTQTVRKKPTKEEANEEPEWFTFGPSSQFETMELKGFDDLENLKKSKGKDLIGN